MDPRAAQNAILMEVYALAQHHAIDLVRSQYREDIVQNFALACLRSLRDGTWDVSPDGIDLFVRMSLINRRVTNRKSRKRDLNRSTEYLATDTDLPSEGLRMHSELEDHLLDRWANGVRATADKKALRAHRMVRESHMTYVEVAAELGAPVRRVHEYVKIVQRAFREALPTIEIDPPTSARGGRVSQQAWRSTICQSRGKQVTAETGAATGETIDISAEPTQLTA
jgi:DNA-directed RNA polymerase specialized sigma24 family protein